MDIFYHIKNSWNDRKELARLMIEIVEKQMSLAEDIASASISEQQAFIDEAGFGNLSKARARAKTITGEITTKYKYQFEALSNLLKVVMHRVTFLQSPAHQVDNPQLDEPSFDPQAKVEDHAPGEEEPQSTLKNIP